MLLTALSAGAALLRRRMFFCRFILQRLALLTSHPHLLAKSIIFPRFCTNGCTTRIQQEIGRCGTFWMTYLFLYMRRTLMRCSLLTSGWRYQKLLYESSGVLLRSRTTALLSHVCLASHPYHEASEIYLFCLICGAQLCVLYFFFDAPPCAYRLEL